VPKNRKALRIAITAFLVYTVFLAVQLFVWYVLLGGTDTGASWLSAAY
jgi:hypothetical protein